MIAWVVVILSLVFMLPWTRWLLHRTETKALFPSYNPLLLALTVLGVSIGTLSLVMLWIGLVGRPIDWRAAAIICLIIGGSGFLLRDRLLLQRDDPLTAVPAKQFRDIGRATWIVIAVIAGLILFNAVYWPFGVDDAVTIYATFGKAITTTRQLPVGNLYELYPMLVPLNYAFAFQASGWANEYLAALYPALLSVGVIGVAYLLGRELYNRAAGLIAAALVALTPMITHWASTGYVDLPAAFYYGMAALFLARLSRTDHWSDALLSGIMAGLAAWTKNSALIIVISIVLWVAYSAWMRTALSLRHIAIVAGVFVLVAGPWYARNIMMAGTPVPPTGWTFKAERTLANLFPYYVDSRYSVFGLVFTAGLALTLWRLWKSRGTEQRPAFLAIFTLPFFAVWWALFSYDDRFLLLLTPLIAVMSAALALDLWQNVPVPSRMIWLTWVIPLIILLTLPAASAAVYFKFEILRQPLMSDADKHRLRLGTDRYDMALFLRSLPTGSRVWTQDLLLPFNADGVQMTVGAWPLPQQLSGYDYWVVEQGDLGGPCQATPVHTEGTYLLYKVSDAVKDDRLLCRGFLGDRLSR